MGLGELKDDQPFNSIEARARNAKELVALLDQRFVAKPREEWMTILQKDELASLRTEGIIG